MGDQVNFRGGQMNFAPSLPYISCDRASPRCLVL